MRTNIHALSGIRTRNPVPHSDRAATGSDLIIYSSGKITPEAIEAEFNKHHTFILKKEEQNKISYLDLNIYNMRHTLNFNVYRKHTKKQTKLLFMSFNPTCFSYLPSSGQHEN
jgi:hypothetical protein